MSYNVTQTFVKDATTLTLPYPEHPGYSCQPRRAQSVNTTWAGEERVSDRDREWFETEFSVIVQKDIASNADLVAIEAFVQNTIKQRLYEFTWTDINGTAHGNARLLDAPSIEPLAGSLYRVTFRVQTSEMVY